MTSAEDLKPTRKHRVFDLAEKAGLNMSDWRASARRASVKANPKYCYNWAFSEPGRLCVLNLWHEAIAVEGDAIVYRANYRRDAEDNRAIGKAKWAARGQAVDAAVRDAWQHTLPVHVILNDGVRRRHGDPRSANSRVTARELDRERWHVAHYDGADGSFVLRREPRT